MSARELVVLGTASQTPTRYRNHNGYLLRWDGEEVLFDPGEGTQRQFSLADVSPAGITRICITHFHGDHCLGLPGIILRLGADIHDGPLPPVPVHFPASGAPYLHHLRNASQSIERREIVPRPAAEAGIVDHGPPFELYGAPLSHGVDVMGWRIQEPDGRRMLPDRLHALGVRGPDISRLQHDGSIEIDGRTVTLDEVSEHRPGQSFAFVMDTRWCEAALELARGVDLLVCESTFLDADRELADRWGHLTARQAGELAAEAGARRLVLTHFSQRYPDAAAFGDEAAVHFSDVVVASDLLRVDVPHRR